VNQTAPSPSPTLVLVDGSSYLYRAFHALPALVTSQGQHTGAIHGVLNMLRKLQTELAPTRFGVVFDPRGPTTRDGWYDQYKAHRPSMPEELASQVKPLFEIIDAQGIPRFIVDGIEADDVIGTLARQGADAGYRVIISTGDKDFAQLVCDTITLVNTMDNTRLDEAGVEARFGVPPERIVDYLTLVGDAVDNVPGVPKVGPKTAVKWLQGYGSLDGIVAAAEDIKGAVGESLRQHLAQIPLSRRLVTIMTDLTLPFDLDALMPRAPETEILRGLYQRLELNTLLRGLGGAGRAPAPANDDRAAHARPVAMSGSVGDDASTEHVAAAVHAPVPRDHATITDAQQFEDWLQRLSTVPLFAFDTETTSLDYIDARIVGVSLALAPGEAAYVPLAHDYLGAPPQLDRDAVLARLKPLLEDPAVAKLGHNLKYDQSVLANHGITLRGIRHDTMLESYVLNSTGSRHDLDSLALTHLGHQNITFESVAGKGAAQLTFNQVAVDKAAEYAAEDADVCFRLHAALWPRIEALPTLATLYATLEIPLVAVLSRIERRGVLVDAQMLGLQSQALAVRIAETERAAWQAAGSEFNIGSPRQIQEILFERLGLPVTARTPTGQPSTAESALEELVDAHVLPRLILEHRALSKLKSTYTDRLPAEINPATGRIHTSYHQAVAATGRLSSSEPNLQNIPVRTPEGRQIRQAFIAPPGYRVLAADYSQIELRIMAHLSGDARLRAAFAEGLDVHRATAAEVFGLAPAEVSDDQRRSAKAINFGLIYGMSAFGLARQLGIGRGEAQAYMDLYFQRYPGVKEYMEATRELARAQGFVETVFGRRLYLPDIHSRNQQRRQYAERTAINAPMQGTAADIIKRAMIAVDHWIETEAPPAALIMQVHDELVLEVHVDAVDAVAAEVSRLMSGAASLAVPLVVDTGSGGNWDEAH
jgi:DNA polymerase-1